MAKDLKLEEDFFKKHLQKQKVSKNENLKFETLINLAVNGHYPLFFPQWISSSISAVKRPISSREAKKNVQEMLKLIDGHRTLAKKRTALISVSEDKRNVYVRSFIKLVELNILDSFNSGLH